MPQPGDRARRATSTRTDVALCERLGFRETGPVTAHGTEDLTGMWWEA